MASKRQTKKWFFFFFKPSAGRFSLNCPNEQRVSKKDGRKTDSSLRLNVVYLAFFFMKNDRSRFSKTSAPFVFVCHNQLFGRGRQRSQTKPMIMNGKNGGWNGLKRQMDGTKPMESLNKVNGIVGRNQWNR